MSMFGIRLDHTPRSCIVFFISILILSIHMAAFCCDCYMCISHLLCVYLYYMNLMILFFLVCISKWLLLILKQICLELLIIYVYIRTYIASWCLMIFIQYYGVNVNTAFMPFDFMLEISLNLNLVSILLTVPLGRGWMIFFFLVCISDCFWFWSRFV
jgi:hypothetical protein